MSVVEDLAVIARRRFSSFEYRLPTLGLQQLYQVAFRLVPDTDFQYDGVELLGAFKLSLQPLDLAQ